MKKPKSESHRASENCSGMLATAEPHKRAMPKVESYREFDVCEHDFAPFLTRGNGVPTDRNTFSINGNHVDNALYDAMSSFIRARRLVCPYCTERLLRRDIEDASAIHTEFRGQAFVSECTSCGFWYVDGQTEVGFEHGRSICAAGVQQRFPVQAPDPPINELLRFLQENPEHLNSVHPRALEKLVASCFRSYFGGAEAIHVGRPADGGIDVILVIGPAERWLIQCKRRKNNDGVESVDTVRNLLGTLLSENEVRGIVVSTADHFSYHARKLAASERIVAQGYEVKLIDKGKLREMIQGSHIERPWERLVQEQWGK